MEEPEPLPQFGAVRLDGFPEVRVLGVIIDDHYFEIGIVELRYAVERAYDNVRRLGISRHLETHPREIFQPPCGKRGVGPFPLYLSQHFPLLERRDDPAEQGHEQDRIPDIHQHSRNGAYVYRRYEPESPDHTEKRKEGVCYEEQPSRYSEIFKDLMGYNHCRNAQRREYNNLGQGIPHYPYTQRRYYIDVHVFDQTIVVFVLTYEILYGYKQNRKSETHGRVYIARCN